MSQATVRVTNDRPIKLRRLIEIGTRSSLGIVIPNNFVDEMRLRAGNYMAVEMDEGRNSLTLKSVIMPSEDDNA